jgi:hypothetical protein
MCRHSWPLWLIVTTATFGLLETRACRRNCHPTLSRELARWLGVLPRRRYGPVGPWLIAGAGAVLAAHVARYQETPC